MIVRPRKPGSLDRRLQTLADPELAERLRAAHPELFGDSVSVSAPPRSVEQAPETNAPASQTWRIFAFIGALLAMVAAAVSGLLLNNHASVAVTPLVSISPVAVPRLTKHHVWTHGNLGPAAAQRIIQAQQLWLREHPVVIRTQAPVPTVVAPRIHSAVSPQHQLQPKGHAAVRTRPYEHTSVRHAAALQTSAAPDTSSASTTAGDAAPASENDPSDADITPGRQVPNGPVWTENGPLVIFGGHGGGGGGGSCTPRASMIISH